MWILRQRRKPIPCSARFDDLSVAEGPWVYLPVSRYTFLSWFLHPSSASLYRLLLCLIAFPVMKSRVSFSVTITNETSISIIKSHSMPVSPLRIKRPGHCQRTGFFSLVKMVSERRNSGTAETVHPNWSGLEPSFFCFLLDRPGLEGRRCHPHLPWSYFLVWSEYVDVP